MADETARLTRAIGWNSGTGGCCRGTALCSPFACCRVKWLKRPENISGDHNCEHNKNEAMKKHKWAVPLGICLEWPTVFPSPTLEPFSSARAFPSRCADSSHDGYELLILRRIFFRPNSGLAVCASAIAFSKSLLSGIMVYNNLYTDDSACTGRRACVTVSSESRPPPAGH